MSDKNNGGELPTGVALTALSESFRTDPYPILHKLRQCAPVYLDPQPRRFIVTKHEDVKALLHDKALFMDPRKANVGTFARDVIADSSSFADPPDMLFLDDPDHRRLRSLVSGPFRPGSIERWRSDVRELVERTLDEIEAPEFDLVAAFAQVVPVAVIARMLGIPEAHHASFKRWSDTLVIAGFNPFPTQEQLAEAQHAREALDGFFHEQIEQRCARPGEDLISDMLRAEEDGQSLTRDELVDQCRLLLVAGNVTTTDLISNGVKALLDHPQQLASLRKRPELLNNAIEEMLRYDTPVTNSARVTNRDMEIQACPIGRGESLHLSLAAANRDPQAYTDPDTFNIERENARHVAFGGGRHLCLGAHLARVEAQEAIAGLLDRYPTLLHSARGFDYHSAPSFRGMKTFWVDTRPPG